MWLPLHPWDDDLVMLLRMFIMEGTIYSDRVALTTGLWV